MALARIRAGQSGSRISCACAAVCVFPKRTATRGRTSCTCSTTAATWAGTLPACRSPPPPGRCGVTRAARPTSCPRSCDARSATSRIATGRAGRCSTRLGMTSAVMEPDASGTFVGSSYMLATARDWARFGQLWLDNGRIDGRIVVPEEWVRFSTTPTAESPDGRYGAHWWLKLNPEIGGDDPVARTIAAGCVLRHRSRRADAQRHPVQAARGGAPRGIDLHRCLEPGGIHCRAAGRACSIADQGSVKASNTTVRPAVTPSVGPSDVSPTSSPASILVDPGV